MKFCDWASLILHKCLSRSITAGQSFNHSTSVHQAALPGFEGLSSRSCTLPSRACIHACGNLKTLEPVLAFYIYTVSRDWIQMIRLHSKCLFFEPPGCSILRFPIWSPGATSGGETCSSVICLCCAFILFWVPFLETEVLWRHHQCLSWFCLLKLPCCRYTSYTQSAPAPGHSDFPRTSLLCFPLPSVCW